MESRDGVNRYDVPMVRKTLSLLEAFSVNGAALSFTEAVKICGLSKASAFRILETLRSTGYLSKAKSGRYRLTHKFVELAMVAHEVHPIRRTALGYLQQLQQTTGETVNFGMFQQNHVVYAEVLESTLSLRAVPRVGSVAALHATALGKAIAASLPKEHLAEILQDQSLRRFTPRTLVTKSALFAELAQIRHQGYAVDDEEETLGCVCVAAPIMDRKGCRLYAISITGPARRMGRTRISQLARAVRAVCRQVQRACGFGEQTADRW